MCNRRSLAILGLLVLATLGLRAPSYGQAKPKVDPKLADRYRSLAASIDSKRIHDTIRLLSAVPSRVVGYPGDAKAADYVQQQFQEIGIQPVRPVASMEERFSSTV